jgi:hypothetical protein
MGVVPVMLVVVLSSALSHTWIDPGKSEVNMTFAVKVRLFKTTPLPEHTGMVVPATVRDWHCTLVLMAEVPSHKVGGEPKKKEV